MLAACLLRASLLLAVGDCVAVGLLQLHAGVSPTARKGKRPQNVTPGLSDSAQAPKVETLRGSSRSRVPVRPPSALNGRVLPESWVWDQLEALPEGHPPAPEFVRFASKTKNEYQFMHIPKNAGMAVERAADAVGIKWGELNSAMQGQQQPMKDGYSCSRWHIPPEELSEPNPYKEAQSIFCVTRHPFNKLVSEYTWRVQGGFRPAGSDGGFPDCTEESLNFYLQHVMKQILKGKRTLQDCHFVPQSQFIWDADTGNQECDEILRFDDLPSELDRLMKKWDLPVTLVKEINSSEKKCPGLSTQNLTVDTQKMITEIYEEDFKRLDYDPEILY